MSAEGDDDPDDDGDDDREDNVGDDGGEDEDEDDDEDDDDDKVDRNVSLAVVAVLAVLVTVAVASVDRGGRRLLGWRRAGRRCRRSRLPSPMVSSKRAPSSRAHQQFSCEQYQNSMPPRCARAVSFSFGPLSLFLWGPPLPLLHRKKISFSNKKKDAPVGAWRSFWCALSIFFRVAVRALRQRPRALTRRAIVDLGTAAARHAQTRSTNRHSVDKKKFPVVGRGCVPSRSPLKRKESRVCALANFFYSHDNSTHARQAYHDFSSLFFSLTTAATPTDRACFTLLRRLFFSARTHLEQKAKEKEHGNRPTDGLFRKKKERKEQKRKRQPKGKRTVGLGT